MMRGERGFTNLSALVLVGSAVVVLLALVVGVGISQQFLESNRSSYATAEAKYLRLEDARATAEAADKAAKAAADAAADQKAADYLAVVEQRKKDDVWEAKKYYTTTTPNLYWKYASLGSYECIDHSCLGVRIHSEVSCPKGVRMSVTLLRNGKKFDELTKTTPAIKAGKTILTRIYDKSDKVELYRVDELYCR